MAGPSKEQRDGFLLSSVQRLHAINELDVPRENYDEFVVQFGLAAQSLRFIDGYLKLRKVGLAREGHALVRASLEHAIVAQWSYLTPDGTKRLDRRLRQQHRELWEQVIEAIGNDELRAELANMPAIDMDRDWPNFWRGILVPVDSEGFLGSMYAALSQVVHPSPAIYSLVSDDDGEVVLNHLRDDERWGFYASYAAVASCMLSRWVIARLLRDEQELRRLDALSDGLQTPMRLDHQLPVELRRFADEI